MFGAFFLALLTMPLRRDSVPTTRRRRACRRSTDRGYVPLNERPHGGHVRLLALVGAGEKRVLDVGCSSGYLARPLVERGCTVVGIERDPAGGRGGARRV